jgi:hypothetical protein
MTAANVPAPAVTVSVLKDAGPGGQDVAVVPSRWPPSAPMSGLTA